MDIKVLDDNPLYKDETYRLKFTFSSKYPIGESAVTLCRALCAHCGIAWSWDCGTCSGPRGHMMILASVLAAANQVSHI